MVPGTQFVIGRQTHRDVKKKKTSMIYLEIESEILGDELDVKDEGGGARMTLFLT